MKRIVKLALTLLIVCAFMLPILASCDIGGGSDVWFYRKDGDIKYYISFNEKKEELLVVVVDGKDAESFTFDYEIDDDEIEIKDSLKNKEVFSYKEKSESYVTIDGVKFKFTDEGPDDYDDGERDMTVYELVGKLGESVLSGTYTAENNGETAIVTFGADGSVTITVMHVSNGISANSTYKVGTYEIKENEIAITFDGETQKFPYSYENGDLIIDGIEYSPSKAPSVIIRPSVTVGNDKETVPGDEPFYTVPEYSVEPPIYTAGPNEDYTVAVPETEKPDSIPVIDSEGFFTATYESYDHDGDGKRHIWVFDRSIYTVYEISNGTVTQSDKGTYYTKGTVVIFESVTNGNRGKFNLAGDGFEYQKIQYYYISPAPNHPETDYVIEEPIAPNETLNGIYESEIDKKTGRHFSWEFYGDGTYVKYFGDGSNYTVIDEGSYTVDGNYVVCESHDKDSGVRYEFTLEKEGFYCGEWFEKVTYSFEVPEGTVIGTAIYLPTVNTPSNDVYEYETERKYAVVYPSGK